MSVFNYKILLDENLNAKDREFLMNIIDFCTIKQILPKQLELKLYDQRDSIKIDYNMSRMWIQERRDHADQFLPVLL